MRYIRCMLASALPTHVVAQALRFLLDEEPDPPELPREERARLAKVLRELDVDRADRDPDRSRASPLSGS